MIDFTNEKDALACLDVLKRRSERKAPLFHDPNFPKQTSYIQDPSKYKAGFCTRRAGKSYGAGLELFKDAYETDEVSCLYVALTRLSAQRIMFKDVFKVINRELALGANFNNVDLTVSLPNASQIYCLGMDSSEDEAQKVLGQKFKKIVIDEAGSFRRDLRPIVYGVLNPATTDLNGTISLQGTPTPYTKGLFFDIVWAKTEPGWSVHQWTAHDNPHMREKWEAEIKDLMERFPGIVDTPSFKQNYLGQYSIDADKLVYKYNETRNVTKKVPDEELIYVLGVDLGFDDPSAFVVCGYSAHDSTLYVVETYKKSGMIISDVAERVKYFQNKYNPYKTVVDNASKQAVEELKQRYGLPMSAAEKTGKAEFIEIANSELLCSRVKLLEGQCDELVSEWLNLIWDDKSDKRLEHPNCDNHLADAFLYSWRFCYQYLSKPKDKPKNDQQKLDIWFDKESARVMSKDTKPFWERDWEQ